MDTLPETKSPHILILEDNTAHQDLAIRALDPEEFRVSIAGTVSNARVIIGIDPPDLIIADWLLPDGKGIEILTRKDGKVTTPLIIMTSHGDEHLAVEIMKSGAIDYIVKSATAFKDLPHITRRALRDWDNIQERVLAEDETRRLLMVVKDEKEKLSALINSITDEVWFTDLQHRFTLVNPSALKEFGLDLTGETVVEELAAGLEILRPDGTPRPLEEAPPLRALKGEIVRNMVEVVRTPAHEELRYRQVSAAPVRDTSGVIIGAVSVVRDISEQKKAEEALRTAEIRFRALIHNSSDIIRILDKDHRIIYESTSAERILGYPPGYLIGKNPFDYIHPEDLGRVKDDFRELYEKRNTGIPTEFRTLKADGKNLWVDAIGTNLLDVPEVNGIVITIHPIQQRKEVELALLDNQNRLTAAMDIAGLVNWEYDVASATFTFDDRFYTLYGTKADCEGGNLMSAETYMREFVYPEDRQKVLAEIQKLLATKDPTYTGQMEHRITPRDGSVRTIIARYAPVFDLDGKIIRTFGANQDITDFKLMDSEIRSLNTVLEQRIKDRTEALVETNEKLEEENAQRLEAEKKLQGSYDEKVLLLKEVHHRVKNNLQIIASLLNLQSRYIKDESSQALIKESQNRVKAMALVHEKLYRSESISKISLNDYINFLGKGLFQFYDARSRGIKFTLEILDVGVDIDAAIPLGLIMNELISNSLKYAFPDGRRGEIFISVKKEEHTLTVLYRDTGVGIPEELDWRDAPSLGMRLVITLVDQMDGTIELDRSAGTQFTMVVKEKERQ